MNGPMPGLSPRSPGGFSRGSFDRAKDPLPRGKRKNKNKQKNIWEIPACAGMKKEASGKINPMA
jgi:hypothetical protein